MRDLQQRIQTGTKSSTSPARTQHVVEAPAATERRNPPQESVRLF